MSNTFNFPESAPSANPVFFRTYSRRIEGKRESWEQVCQRTIEGLKKLGKLSEAEAKLLYQNQLELKAIASGRWLWVGGTDWIETPENFPGAYNCSSTNIEDWQSFALLMELAMMGCGTGAVLEQKYIAKLPPIQNQLNIVMAGEVGAYPTEQRRDFTVVHYVQENEVRIRVGDSRQGWVSSYEALFEIATDKHLKGPIHVTINLSHIRNAGEPLKGFGGVANPVKLPELYSRIAAILNSAVGRQLTAGECCLLLDEAAVVVVAGNIRRSAGIRQFDADSPLLKLDLWQQDGTGNWRIDPKRDALRMANHTRVFHRKPTRKECIEAVRSQYHSGEGAIQWAGEAVARANADILNTVEKRHYFLKNYSESNLINQATLHNQSPNCLDPKELEHRVQRYSLNPCAEIIGSNFFCNLAEIHLNQIDPFNLEEQETAFKSAALSVAVLLHHKFTEPRYQYSREIDPIVGVSVTGLFDFFVNAFGREWLEWWQAGRPFAWDGISSTSIEKWLKEWPPFLSKILNQWDRCEGIFEYVLTTNFDSNNDGHLFLELEAAYLNRWRTIVHETVWEYCDRHGLRRPNRCTTMQPGGTKSLLTGASSGWHPPKAQRFIRRITFRKNDPVALACIDYGYNVIPSQSDKDDAGNLLNDPFDPRCTEWLVEIPTAVPWADLAEDIQINQFSALAQFDFYLQVQQHYVTHNTSGTIEIRENEIEAVGDRIYQAIGNDEGYISVALLARFDDKATYPRLPFEPIDKATYERLHAEVLERRKTENFEEALKRYDQGEMSEAGPAGCDSDKCLIGG